MTILKLLSDFLEGRGWTAELVQADIVHAHIDIAQQVTACALCMVFLRMLMWHIQVNWLKMQLSSPLMTGVIVQPRRAQVFTSGP